MVSENSEDTVLAFRMRIGDLISEMLDALGYESTMGILGLAQRNVLLAYDLDVLARYRSAEENEARIRATVQEALRDVLLEREGRL